MEEEEEKEEEGRGGEEEEEEEMQEEEEDGRNGGETQEVDDEAAASASSSGDVSTLCFHIKASKPPRAVVPTLTVGLLQWLLKWLHAGLLFSVGCKEQRPT